MRLSKQRLWSVIWAIFTVVAINLTTHGEAVGASESVLWNFGNGTDGTDPIAGLIMDASDNLYGTTTDGGTSIACSLAGC